MPMRRRGTQQTEGRPPPSVKLDEGVRQLRSRLPRPATAWVRLLTISVIVGVSAGLAAAALEAGLYVGSELLVGRYVEVGGEHLWRFHWQIMVLPALGGLASGLIVRWLCGSATGHGTDTLVRAFHYEGGNLPMRTPTIKAIAAVGVISCGGSAGPEGPIAALGAAIGSSLARVLALTPRERRVMLIAGCGAGVGAIFQCPMGGALFAAGILYRDPDYETDAFIPAFVAAVMGYSVYLPIWGKHLPLMESAKSFAFGNPLELGPYALLGVVCGLTSIFFYHCLHFVEKLPYDRWRIPRWLAPALGGLATGLIACAIPPVMDSQYVFIRNAMKDVVQPGLASASLWPWVALLGAVIVGKCVATAFTVGSGASGGVLGPSVFIGGAVGAFVGALIDALAPGKLPEDVRTAMVPVGMAGVLSASMRAPLAAIVMVAEMTGGYGLIVPSMLVCVGSYVIGRRWGLNREQLRTSADSPAHAGDAIVHVLETWRVRDLMQREWREQVPPGATLGEIVAMVSPGTRPVFAVVDNSHIVGLISLPDIQRIMDEPGMAEAVIAADMMSTDLVTVAPDDDVYFALARMARDNHIVAPVVTADGRKAFLGMISRHEIYAALRRHLENMRRDLLVEHAGLAAIDREEGLHQLVMGAAAPKVDNIQRLLVPMQAVGRSLRESDFRRNFGVQVIAIERADGTIECPPNPDRPLETSQRLVAIMLESTATAAS